MKYSVEGWLEGGKGARELGHNIILPGDQFPKSRKADIVIANPPCSRFSTLSSAFYSAEDKTSLANFPELLQTHETVGAANARLFWWETGPMAWSKGGNMIAEHHERMKQVLDCKDITTAVVKYDCRYGGHPQRRVRTHIFHFRGKQKLTAVPEADWSDEGLKIGMGKWLRARVGKRKMEAPVIPFGFGDERCGNIFAKNGKKLGVLHDPKGFAEMLWSPKYGIIFVSARPRVVFEDDRFTHVTLAVPNLMLPQNRWMDLSENAAVMDYPIGKVMEQWKGTTNSAWKLVTLLSKSVCPSASEWLYENLAARVLNREQRTDGVQPIPTSHPGIFHYDLSTGDGCKIHTSEANRKFASQKAVPCARKSRRA